MKALRKIGYFFIVAIVVINCRIQTRQPQQVKQDSTTKSSKTIISESLGKAFSEFNRGAALLEQYRYAEAATAFEAVLDIAPDWNAARFNLGLANLNMQVKPGAKNYLQSAREAFETVLQRDSQHLHARFCLGLYYEHLADNEKTLECFQAVYEADKTDPHVLYKYAETLINLGRQDEGTRVLEKIITLDPGFISAVYRLATQYQRQKEPDKARTLFVRFQELKNAELTGGTFTVLKAYGTVGKYYMALGPDNLPRPLVHPSQKTRVLFSPEIKFFDDETSVWNYPGGIVALPGIAAGDIDSDGDLDLCMTAFGTNGGVWLWHNDGAGGFSHKATLAQQGICPCFGDVDNDGDLDLWLGCAGPDLYLENDGKGNFIKSEASSVAGGDVATTCARLLDIDSDGDLDFLALRFARGSVPATTALEPTASSLFNNNRDGSFIDIAEKLGLTFEKTPMTNVVYDDFDNDRDLDLIVFSTGNSKAVGWMNDRVWKYRILDAEATGLSVEGVFSATSGDPDKDGDRDLLIFTDKGLYLFMNQAGFRFTRHEDFANRHSRLGGTGGQFADIDNDGDLDILIADAFRGNNGRGPVLLINDWPQSRFINVLEIDPGNLLSAITFKGNAGCVAADFTGNGKCDILLAPIGDKPLLVENVSPDGHWIEIDLLGTCEQDKKSRSNNSAIGARVEVKTGTISQQYVIGVPSGQVAMPPYRIHAGLGEYAKIDWLRIMWPDAVLQAELELPADQVITITELQRKVSSCPHLFAWNGSHFQFISDFGGMGGIGYLLAPDSYSKPDPTEYLPVPNLQPRDGEYILQVLEPIEEVVYFDEAKLIAIDHPIETEVYPNEMMAVSAPPPTFEIFCLRDSIEPVRAVDHRGIDVTEKILTIDRSYTGATDPDPRFTGFAKDHFVELDFGEHLQTVSPHSRLVLFLHGSVEYAYSSTNFAASQAGMRLQAPSIYAFRNGTWIKLFHEVGYPGGIQHMMTLDVTGRVLPSDQRIRICSNMELYWDRIFMASILEKPQLHIREVPVKSADLHFLGYPRQYSPDGRHPNLYDYGNVDRAVAWKIMQGNYTRYGEVSELLEKADDCYVIMGRGEELTLRFPVDTFGPTPKGCHRSFILKTDSFCKDMDLYSAYPDTVEPLPFHSMSSYPYEENEKYPDGQKWREYRERFNTRCIGGSEN